MVGDVPTVGVQTHHLDQVRCQSKANPSYRVLCNFQANMSMLMEATMKTFGETHARKEMTNVFSSGLYKIVDVKVKMDQLFY